MKVRLCSTRFVFAKSDKKKRGRMAPLKLATALENDLCGELYTSRLAGEGCLRIIEGAARRLQVIQHRYIGAGEAGGRASGDARRSNVVDISRRVLRMVKEIKELTTKFKARTFGEGESL